MESMKPFETYQNLEDEQMTERDKLEKGSKFWNEGKWESLVAPLLPKDCQDMTLIDVGCNAGLFLKLAKNAGFKRAIGIEPDKNTYKRAVAYRDRNGFDYEIINNKVENCIENLPVADVTLLVNTHYYISADDWLKYIEILQDKTNYCIIVTAKKKPNSKYAPSDTDGLMKSFKDWNNIFEIIEMPADKTPHSRYLTALRFTSNSISRVLIDSLDNGNNQQRDFLKQLDKGRDLLKTDYYRRLKDYRKRTGSKQEIWSKDKLINYMNERVALYNNVKKYGLKNVIEVRSKDNRIVDGNHRHAIAKHLGYKTMLIKKV